MMNRKSGTILLYIVLFFLALSGFAQMPIFKRYYIADLPGMAWLAQFYVTHMMHYIFASLFLGYIAYAVIRYLAGGTSTRLTKRGWVKSIAFAGLIVTGILMVIKNMAWTPFSHTMIIGLDILHLIFCFTWIITLVVGLFVKEKVKDTGSALS